MKRHALLIVALVLAAALRLYHLGHRSLWFDEMLTQWLSAPGVSFGYLLEQLRHHDQTPPLYHLVTRVFVMAVGDSEGVLRLPAAVAGVGAVAGVYGVARRACGEFAGGAAAVLLAANPFAVWYAQEARPYSFMLCFAMLSTHAFLWLLQEAPRRRGADAYYVVATALLLYSHPFGVLVIAAQVLGYFIAARMGRARLPLLRVLADLGLVGLLFAPWLPILLEAARVAMGSYWATDVGLGEIPVTYWLMANTTAAVVGFLIVVVVATAAERRRAGFWVVLLVMVLPVVVPVVASVVRRPMFTTRFAIPAAGGMCAVAGCGVGVVRSRVWRGVALVVLAGLPWVPVTRAPERAGFVRDKQHWREFGEYLHEALRAGDVVLYTPGFMKLHWDYYVRRPDVRAVPFMGAVPEVRGVAAGGRVWVVSAVPVSTPRGTPAFSVLLQVLDSPGYRVVGHHAGDGLLAVELEPRRTAATGP